MYGLRGNRAREKTAWMPDPLRRSSFGCTTLDSRRMDMDMVVTVAAGTRCAWYGLTGPLDAEQSPPGPGT